MTANYRLKVAGSSKYIKAFTYTHCDYDFYDRGSMRLMQDYMLVNISCETVDEAITEKEYGLCSRDREAVVIFEVHGNNKGKARRVIQIKRAQH